MAGWGALAIACRTTSRNLVPRERCLRHLSLLLGEGRQVGMSPPPLSSLKPRTVRWAPTTTSQAANLIPSVLPLGRGIWSGTPVSDNASRAAGPAEGRDP